MKTVAVIGGGPVGSEAARLLAEGGYDVHIFEEHDNIGRPVQCTGIVSSALLKIVSPPKSCILTSIKSAYIIGPRGKGVEIMLRRPNLVLDRKKFDSFLSERAKVSGATIHLDHKLVRMERRTCIFSHKGKEIPSSFDIVVGADGPLSVVAKQIKRRQKYWTGIQAIVPLKNDGRIRFFPHISTIGWIVPEDSANVRIGVMGGPKAKMDFNHFLKSVLGQGWERQVKEIQAGLVPIYDPSFPTQKGNLFLVGDAAGQVKATTGGGIVPGLLAARALAKSLKLGKRYDNLWKEEIGKGLWLHLRMRQALDRMSRKDYENLVRTFRKPKLRKILGSVERDYPARLIKKLLFAEPSLIRYGRFLF